MILITKCYQKINLSPRLRAEDQFLFFHLTRLKKKKKTGFVIRVTVLNQLMSLFSLSIVQYILNIRYAIDTYFQVQKEIQKKKKTTTKNKHNTHLHIYRFADVTQTSWYSGPGERHAACAQAKNGQV